MKIEVPEKFAKVHAAIMKVKDMQLDMYRIIRDDINNCGEFSHGSNLSLMKDVNNTNHSFNDALDSLRDCIENMVIVKSMRQHSADTIKEGEDEKNV